MNETPTYPVSEFDPLEPQTLQCPFPWYRSLRRDAPVHFVAEHGLWFVTSRELVAQAAADYATFSSGFELSQAAASESARQQIDEIQAQGWPDVATLLTADPPEHHYYRRMLAKTFTPRFVTQFEPYVRKIAAELADTLDTPAPADFVKSFAEPLPLRVIAHVLNVPDDRIGDFKSWSDQFTATVGAHLDDPGLIERARILLEFQHYFAAELDDRRTNPCGDLLSGLVAAPSAEDSDEPLSTAACLSLLGQLLVAGNETSTKLLAGAMHELARAPKWWDWLREDPEHRAADVAEESLRLLAPVQSMLRITKTEARLGDCTIPAGALVALVFGSANRDEAVFDQPDEFDPQRGNAKAHLAFGTGIHSCLGAPLARLEARVALQELARRYRTVRLGDDNDFTYEPSFMLRGLTRLRLTFTAAGA